MGAPPNVPDEDQTSADHSPDPPNGTHQTHQTAKSPETDPVISEVTNTVLEWRQIWRSLYLEHQIDLFERVGQLLVELIDARTDLLAVIEQRELADCSTADAVGLERQINELKAEVVHKLDVGNRLLSLDLVPRDANFKFVDPIELSPVKLYRLHVAAASASSNASSLYGSSGTYGCQDSIVSGTGSTLSSSSHNSDDSYHNTNASAKLCSHHLQLSLAGHSLTSLLADETIEVYFSLVEHATSNSVTSGNSSNTGFSVNPSSNNSYAAFKPVTEKFLVQIQGDHISHGLSNTVFTNIGQPNAANRELYLLVQVYRVGRMTLPDSHKTAFGKQQSSHNLQPTSLEGTSQSFVAGTTKLSTSDLSKVRMNGYADPFASRYKRPFGASAVYLKDRIKFSNYRDMPLSLRIQAMTDAEFVQVSETLSRRNNHTSKNNPNSPQIRLDLSLKFISCAQEFLAKVVNATPYCLTEKRGFPDVVMPGDFKNDLFFTLESAEFEKGGKSISKNIEASISLIDKSGLVIDKCISPASNCDNVSSFKSCVFYHSNSPKWNECIKINVPLTEFDGAHVRIEFKHCSTKEKDKKFLGFSFLPLSDEDGTVIPDKNHELYLYKCDPQLWEDEFVDLCKYTSLPHGPSTVGASQPQSNGRQSLSSSQQPLHFSHSNRENVVVNTFLLSTKLTQNSNLLNLLKWRELVKRNNKDFEMALRKALVLRGEEIVKFLQDILDTLFDTFTMYSSSENDYCALIFKVLVHIFLLLEEPKYQHFRPVLDTYASAHFSATLVYRGLLACVKRCLEYSSVVERHVPIQKCFKSIKYVFQFIVQSKILYSKATGERDDELFLNDLRYLFNLFERLLTNHNTKLIPIQVTFLEYFPGALEHLAKVVNAHELAKLVICLAGSVGFSLPAPLSQAKLRFMREATMSCLTKNQEIRMQLAENFCIHIDYFIRHSEELELCHEVLESLIIKVYDLHWPSIYRLHQLTLKNLLPPDDTQKNLGANSNAITVGEIASIKRQLSSDQTQADQLDLAIASLTMELEPFINLMDPLLQLLDMLVKDFNTDRILIQRYCTYLLTVLKLMGDMSYKNFMKRRKLDYLKLCNLFRSFRAVYNRDWSVMQLTSHAILEHPINQITKDIIVRHEYVSMIRQVSSYVKLVVDFITHPTVQIETFSAGKRAYIHGTFGDLRIKFACQLMEFWAEQSKAHICDLIPSTMQSFLEASLIPNDELQQKLIPVFYDMIDAEDRHKLNSRQIELCLIDNIDLFLNLDRGTTLYVTNFNTILRDLIASRSPSWSVKGLTLIDSFTELMNLLIDYRQSLNQLENSSKQMNCLVNLLDFYKERDRLDLHLRYLFKLCDMHLESGSHIEAAFTLKIYTDEIRWSNKNLSPLDGYRPEEQEWHRKEFLYQRIIQYFDLGKCWEENISLCKELAGFYENFLVDYEKVAATLRKLAQFLENILVEHRPKREYFKVEFLGKDLPEFVRGKEFIYRGGEYERLSSFMQRMTLEFPDVQVLNPISRQSISSDSPGQYMVVLNVKPMPSLQEHFKASQRNIKDKVLQYYLNNRLDTFSYDEPVVRAPTPQSGGTVANPNSCEPNVKHLWIKRHVFKTKKQLPNILPWTEIVSQEFIEISPINHATETITNMNIELIRLIQSYKTEPTKPVSPLTMRLQGVIEAAVNGGPAVFVKAFLRPQPNEDRTNESPEQLSRLKDLLRQQFSILEKGLAVHAKLIPPEMHPLHARLIDCLQTIKATLYEETSVSTAAGSAAPTENNYEAVGPLTDLAAASQGDTLSAKDELDGPMSGNADLNGNIYGDVDEQIYSQPTEPTSTAAKPIIGCNRYSTLSNGSRSELSSPSRSRTASHQHLNAQHQSVSAQNSYGASSSLSTLAVLSNMSVNRSRLSLTPSRDPPLPQHPHPAHNNNHHHHHHHHHHHRGTNGRAHQVQQQLGSLTLRPGSGLGPPPVNREALCMRAARKINFEHSSTSALRGDGRTSLPVSVRASAGSRMSTSTLGSAADDDGAPPLPPRSFATADGKTLNSGEVVLMGPPRPRNQSPSLARPTTAVGGSSDAGRVSSQASSSGSSR